MTDIDLSTWSLEDICETWERELVQVVRDVNVPLVASLELEAAKRGVEIESVFSAITAGTRDWNPDLHPRGKDGQFIELFGIVELIGLSFNGKDGKMKSVDGRRGKVMAINPDPKNPGNPKIRVALLDKNGKPSVVIENVKPNQIIQAPEKARLDQGKPGGLQNTVKRFGADYSYDPELNDGKTLDEAAATQDQIGFVDDSGEQIYVTPNEIGGDMAEPTVTLPGGDDLASLSDADLEDRLFAARQAASSEGGAAERAELARVSQEYKSRGIDMMTGKRKSGAPTDEAADVKPDADIDEAVAKWEKTGDPVDGTDAANLMLGRGKERGDSDEKIRSDIGDVFGDDVGQLDISDAYKWNVEQPSKPNYDELTPEEQQAWKDEVGITETDTGFKLESPSTEESVANYVEFLKTVDDDELQAREDAFNESLANGVDPNGVMTETLALIQAERDRRDAEVDDGGDMSSGPDWQQTGVDTPAQNLAETPFFDDPKFKPVIMEAGFRMQQQGAVDDIKNTWGASPNFHDNGELEDAYMNFERQLDEYRDTMTGGRLNEVNEAKGDLIDSYYDVQDAEGWDELDDDVRDSFTEMFEIGLFEGDLNDFKAPVDEGQGVPLGENEIDKVSSPTVEQVIMDENDAASAEFFGEFDRMSIDAKVADQLSSIPDDVSPEIRSIWERSALGTAIKNATDQLQFEPNDMSNPNVVQRANLSLVKWDKDYKSQLAEIRSKADDPALLDIVDQAEAVADGFGKAGGNDGGGEWTMPTGTPPDQIAAQTGLPIVEAKQIDGGYINMLDADGNAVAYTDTGDGPDMTIRSGPAPGTTDAPDAAETPAVAEARAKATPETWGGRVAVFDDTGEPTYDSEKPFTVWVTNDDGSKNGGRGSFATREEAEAYAAETNRLTDLIEGKGTTFELDDDAAVARILELDAQHGGKVGYPDLRGFEGQEREEFAELRGWSQGHRDLYDQAMDEKLADMPADTGTLSEVAQAVAQNEMFDGYDVSVLSKGQGILSEDKFNTNFDKGYYGTLPESDRAPLRQALIDRAAALDADFTSQDETERANFLEANRAKAVPFSEAKKGSIVIVKEDGVEKGFKVDSKSGGRLYGHTLDINGSSAETYWGDGARESDVVDVPSKKTPASDLGLRSAKKPERRKAMGEIDPYEEIEAIDTKSKIPDDVINEMEAAIDDNDFYSSNKPIDDAAIAAWADRLEAAGLPETAAKIRTRYDLVGAGDADTAPEPEPQAAPDAQVTGPDTGFEGSTVKLLDGADATPDSKVINVKDGKTYTIEGVYNSPSLKQDTYVRLRDADGKLSYKSKRSLKAAPDEGGAEAPVNPSEAPSAPATSAFTKDTELVQAMKSLIESDPTVADRVAKANNSLKRNDLLRAIMKEQGWEADNNSVNRVADNNMAELGKLAKKKPAAAPTPEAPAEPTLDELKKQLADIDTELSGKWGDQFGNMGAGTAYRLKKLQNDRKSVNEKIRIIEKKNAQAEYDKRNLPRPADWKPKKIDDPEILALVKETDAALWENSQEYDNPYYSTKDLLDVRRDQVGDEIALARQFVGESNNQFITLKVPSGSEESIPLEVAEAYAAQQGIKIPASPPATF